MRVLNEGTRCYYEGTYEGTRQHEGPAFQGKKGGSSPLQSRGGRRGPLAAHQGAGLRNPARRRGARTGRC